jgi:iron-sulfur cluster repair protein YtfE (RIC family)
MAARSRKKATRKAPARKAPPQPIASWRENADEVDHLAHLTAKALAAGELEAARRHFAEYHDLLLKHLAHEEDVSFPLAERVAPSAGQPIKSLRVAHIGIRRDLEQVGAHLALGHADAARAVFGAFLESFAAHERLEDQLVELLRKSPAGAGSARRSG